jgi:hypothetical protein
VHACRNTALSLVQLFNVHCGMFKSSETLHDETVRAQILIRLLRVCVCLYVCLYVCKLMLHSDGLCVLMHSLLLSALLLLLSLLVLSR